LNKLLPHLAVIGASLIYGINYTVAKGLMPGHLEPLGFILTRASGALILFWLLGSFYKSEKIERKDFIRLAFCGFFGVALNQSFFFSGLNLTTPINAAIIMTTNPIMVLIATGVILKERLTKTRWLGIAIGLSGALLVIALGKSIHFGSDTMLGDLMIFINATSYGIYLVIVKPLMVKYKPLTIIKWVFLFGTFYIFPFGIGQFTDVEWSTFDGSTWGATFLAYLFNIYALKSLSPSVVSIYIYAQPVIASLIAVILGADSLDSIKIMATLLIFVGVYLVSKPIRKAIV
jgi:drug/metabolite transporter (DMT)-like permease